MKKKIVISLLLAGVLATTTFLLVIAGSVFDYGTLAGKTETDSPPPEGAVNWIAWNYEDFDGIPLEILTEDSTNPRDGVNLGYSKGLIEPEGVVHWVLQVENFLDKPGRNDPIHMVFGGLGDEFSGILWKHTILRWTTNEELTDHGQIGIHTTEGAACPIIEAQPLLGPEVRMVHFSGQPDAFYLVYRSQNASGADNNASNGQYFYLFSTTTDEFGLGDFSDSEPWDGPNWYLVIQADPNTKEIIGCHSEEGEPTNVRVVDFAGEYNDETHTVDLTWSTTSETDILGFYIDRSTSLHGDRVRLNEDEMIEAKSPGSPEGNDYALTDDDLDDVDVYYYWLEVVGTEGRQSIGPVFVTLRADDPLYEVFFPLFFQ